MCKRCKHLFFLKKFKKKLLFSFLFPLYLCLVFQSVSIVFFFSFFFFQLEGKHFKQKIAGERKMLEQMAREYNLKKNGKQQNVLKDHDRLTQSPVREQEVPAKVDQGL